MTYQPCLFLLAALLSGAAFAADPVNHVYTPAAGVHEMKMFHACHDDVDVQKRQRINLVMSGLASTDVELVARAIASAIVAGWEPLSRGKTVAIVVDETGG